MEMQPDKDNKLVLTDPARIGPTDNAEQLLRETQTLRARVVGLERSYREQERVERALVRSLQEWEATFNATKDSITV
ncbi:MAG: hypothetical protein ABSH16_13995, partial [Sedimentisphaerales bacterium]